MHAEHHHEHEHDCSCGHEHHHHDHEHDCSCGHEHHHHEHEHDCSCGHEHHHHEHKHDCSCGHEHHHSENHLPTSDMHRRVYILEHLGCANCAAKMEACIRNLPGVEDAVLTFATKQLNLYTRDNSVDFLSDIQTICASIEDEVVVSERKERPRHSSYNTNTQAEHASDLKIILGGAVLFAAGIISEHLGASLAASAVFIAAYLLLGLEIVRTAVGNLIKGHVFDENFLMSIATIAAFCIGDFAEAVGVMLFFRIGEYFEERAVEKSRSQIMEAVDMRPETVQFIHDDLIETIPAEDVQPGSLILIRPGDRIPLDGTVIEGESRIDTSPVTGEPVPVSAFPGTSLISGCVNISGVLKMHVDKTLEHSMVTRILDSVENAAASKPVIDRFITRFARIYTPFVVVLALATAIIPSLITGEWRHWIYTAITFLVISCPCALVLSVPLAFFSGIGAGSRKGILFKGGVSLEAICKIKAVVMDKTGTLTKGNFAVQELLPVPDMTPEQLLAYAAGCEVHSSHPIAQSILSAACERGIVPPKPDRVEEIPGKGICAHIGADRILCGNRTLLTDFSVETAAADEHPGCTEIFIAKNDRFLGQLIISDTLKPDSPAAIRQIRRLNLKTVMLTGDNPDSAYALAQTLTIDEVHAKLLPEDKLSKLIDMRNRLGAVMYIGDGINDAPVLAGADVGAAMGSGADAAIEAADVVFMNSNMSAVPEAIRIAKLTKKIAWQNVIFALGIKLLVMILGLTGFASMWIAVFADTGVAMLCVLNSIRILYIEKKSTHS